MRPVLRQPVFAAIPLLVPVRDGSGAVRAAMNVTVHSAETSVRTLLESGVRPARTLVR